MVTKEEQMKYFLIISACLLAACVEPKLAPQTELPLRLTTEVIVVEAKPYVAKPQARLSVPTCKEIDARDVEESLHLKLDCIWKHAKK